MYKDRIRQFHPDLVVLTVSDNDVMNNSSTIQPKSYGIHTWYSPYYNLDANGQLVFQPVQHRPLNGLSHVLRAPLVSGVLRRARLVPGRPSFVSVARYAGLFRQLFRRSARSRLGRRRGPSLKKCDGQHARHRGSGRRQVRSGSLGQLQQTSIRTGNSGCPNSLARCPKNWLPLNSIRGCYRSPSAKDSLWIS